MMRASLCLFQNAKLATPGLTKHLIHPKAKFKLKDEIQEQIDAGQMKAKKHPGIIKRSPVALPKWTLDAMDQSLDDVDRKKLFKESKIFSNYLFSRRLPVEEQEVRNKSREVEKKVLEEARSKMTPEQFEKNLKAIEKCMKRKVKNELYKWQGLQYDSYKSLSYMIACSAAEYSVMHTIFNEIKIRDPSFVPTTMLDFGSGVGTVLWAALDHWKRNINEYVSVEISSDMNDLADKIMAKSPIQVKGTFHRQYMPVSNLRHDIVVSAYSLLEMPSMRHRLETIAKLWKKTNNYLVLVEQGSNAGFQVIEEARSFIKHVMDNLEKDTKYSIFSPCPHEGPCPRLGDEKKTPCNFLIHHPTLPLLGRSVPKAELYSYVVFKKGAGRTENDSWYRLVRPTLLRVKHVVCRACTTDGKLENIFLTKKKNGKVCYKCAKSTNWGDRLPLDRVIRSKNSEENENVEALEIGGESNSDSESDSENEEPEIKLNEEISDSDKTVEESKEEVVIASKAPYIVMKDTKSE